jgi:hypothetical protein
MLKKLNEEVMTDPAGTKVRWLDHLPLCTMTKPPANTTSQKYAEDVQQSLRVTMSSSTKEWVRWSTL